MVRNGESEWTVYLKDGKLPVPAKGKLKAAYNLKVELWVEGTYDVDTVTSAYKPLVDAKGKARTKPSMVTIRVNLK